MADPKPPADDLDDDELAAEFTPRRRGMLSLSLIFVGLGLSAWLLFDNRADFTYWLSSPIPVELGGEGELKAERLADNVYATVHGTPSTAADQYRNWRGTFDFVALKGSCVLVRRPRAIALPVPPGKLAPPPDQAAFQASGRLLEDTSFPANAHEVFQDLVARGGAVPRQGHLWVLLEGQVPRMGFETPAIFALLAFVLAFNALALVRYYRRRAR